MSTYLDVNFRAGQRAPFEERLPITLQGLGDLGFSLFGQPQSWYNRITADQNALTVRLAEITAANQASWDHLWDVLQVSYGGYTPNGVPFTGWAWTKQAILDVFRDLQPTQEPGEAKFAYAEKLLADTAQMVAYYKQIYPEGAQKIQQDAAEFKAKVEAMPPMRSPAEVGWETFESTLKERASALVTWGSGTIAIAGGVALALLLLARR